MEANTRIQTKLDYLPDESEVEPYRSAIAKTLEKQLISFSIYQKLLRMPLIGERLKKALVELTFWIAFYYCDSIRFCGISEYVDPGMFHFELNTNREAYMSVLALEQPFGLYFVELHLRSDIFFQFLLKLIFNPNFNSIKESGTLISTIAHESAHIRQWVLNFNQLTTLVQENHANAISLRYIKLAYERRMIDAVQYKRGFYASVSDVNNPLKIKLDLEQKLRW